MRPSRRAWPRTIGLGLLLAACQPAAPSAVIEPALDGSPERAIGVPPDVVEVRSLGSWRIDDASGTYRVVIRRAGLERIHTLVAVDWIAADLGDGAPAIVASRPLDLLDELGPISVRDVSTRALASGMSIRVPVTNQATGEAGVVDSMAGAPGELTSRYEARPPG